MLCYLFTENEEIPTDLKKDALDLQKTLDWEDDGSEGNLCIVLLFS